MQRILEVDTDVLYQWRDLVPTYQDSITRIRGLYMDNIQCERTQAIYDLKGDMRKPIQEVTLKNITVDEVTEFVKHVKHTEQITEENINYTKINKS